MEIEPVGGVDDGLHLCAPGRETAEERRDRSVDVDDVERFFTEQANQPTIATRVADQVIGPVDPQRQDPKSVFGYLLHERTVATDADDLMSGLPHAAHQRQQKVVHRKIDGADLGDFHETDKRCISPVSVEAAAPIAVRLAITQPQIRPFSTHGLLAIRPFLKREQRP